MCGIFGAISAERNVVPVLLQGLRNLEYRGYDSAGVAVINGRLERVRALGRVQALESRIQGGNLSGHIGIAHTRWATHGAPAERNAHPHISGGVSVVHNGIIENHEEIRLRLCRMGYTFDSDTDTEVIAHLIHAKLQSGIDLLEAVRESATELRGAYAIAVISEGNSSQLVVARNGAPLLLGLGEQENFAASDGTALAAMTRQFVHLEDGDCAELTSDAIRIIDAHGKARPWKAQHSRLTAEAIALGPYRQYMQKEIFEQPSAVANTLEGCFSHQSVLPQVFGPRAAEILASTKAVLILACGTSYHAAMVARYWIERIAGMACSVEIASEYRYREPVVSPGTLVVAISQSGETADTLAAQGYAMSLGHHASLCICNVAESSLVRASDLCFLTRAGPEIGVASTKAFTTQLVSLALLTMALAKLRHCLNADIEQQFLKELRMLPDAIRRTLELEPAIEDWATELSQNNHALFLGRGVHYPIAREGALKLKEISYIHAEAHAAGELKHGPLALVGPEMPVIALAPQDALFEKMKSNLHDVCARGGMLHVLTDGNFTDHGRVRLIHVPSYRGILSPVVYTLPLQLLAYHTATRLGNDVDRPRNLAKSVTVE